MTRSMCRYLHTGLAACFALVAIGWGSVLQAADMPVKAATSPAPAYSAWRIDVTPYGWMPSLNGTSTVKGHVTDADASFFGDIIHRKIPDQLFGLMMAFEARNDRVAILGDFVYMKLGTAKSGARSITLNPILALDVNAGFDLAVKEIIAELAAAYELLRWGAPAGSATSLDIYAGGRFWWQQVEASLNVAPSLVALLPQPAFVVNGGRASAKSGDVTWIDPLVGLRLRHQFVPGQELTLSGDIGGFGVGSRFSWQAVGAYRFQFAQAHGAAWSGMVGYRALHVDYSKGAGDMLYQFDMLQHGPIVGVSARF
jgi:hypothetical protein